MIRFNTLNSDPYVSILFDENKIIEFLADSGPEARKILRRMDEGIKAPSRPSNLIYVNFFFDQTKKILFLLLADDKLLKLKFPGKIKYPEAMNTRIALISATSSQAMMKYFTECINMDDDNRSVYYNIQHFLHSQFYKNQIPIE